MFSTHILRFHQEFVQKTRFFEIFHLISLYIISFFVSYFVHTTRWGDYGVRCLCIARVHRVLYERKAKAVSYLSCLLKLFEWKKWFVGATIIQMFNGAGILGIWTFKNTIELHLRHLNNVELPHLLQYLFENCEYRFNLGHQR